MKIKVKPDDFIVTEQAELSVVKKGRYHLYCLEKELWNTTDAIAKLARQNGLNFSDIGYAGRKDRYAHTYQYITTPDRPLALDTGSENIRITYLGMINEPMAPKLITGNRFQ